MAHLTCCLDLRTAEDTRVLGWALHGEARVTHLASANRLLVHAEAGAELMLMGVPRHLPATARDLRDWYANNPTAAPCRYKVTRHGTAEPTPGPFRLPQGIEHDPALAPLRALFTGQPRGPMNTGRPGDKHGVPRHAPAPSPDVTPIDEHPTAPEQEEERAMRPDFGADEATEQGYVRFSLPAPLSRLEILVASGPPPLAPMSVDQRELWVAPESTLIFVAAPDDQVPDLNAWYADHPDAAPVAITVPPSDAPRPDPPALLTALRELSRRSDRLLPVHEALSAWVAAERTRQMRRAVRAQDLRDFVATHGGLPETLAGSSGLLYVGVWDDPTGLGTVDLLVGTQTPAPEPLMVSTLDPATGEISSRLYLPTGLTFLVRDQEGSEAVPPSLLLPHGALAPLRSHDAAALLATGSAVQPKTFSLVPQQQEPALPDPTDGPPSWADDEPVPELSAEELAEINSAFDGAPVPRFDGADASDPSDEGDLRSAPGHRTAFDGTINVQSWRNLNPSGPLWVAELLRAVATDAELHASGCLAPVRLLAKGFSLSRSSEGMIDRFLDERADRVADVRVFTLNGRTYFSRLTEDGLRIVGPKGRVPRDAQVREHILKTYDVDDPPPVLGEDEAPPAPARPSARARPAPVR